MGSIITLFVAIVSFKIQISLSQPISCGTYSGNLSSTDDDALSFISCPLSQPIMVSCGYESESGKGDGGYISNSICYAQNGNGGSGVKAYATCCSVTGGATCIDVDATLTDPKDDEKEDIYCPSDYELTGCTVNSAYKSFDGIRAYDGDYCTVQAANTNPLTGYARCCKSADVTKELSCTVAHGTSTTKTGSVTCPAGLVMTGCSGNDHWNKISAWYVEDNTCYAERYSSNSRTWNIDAICCEVLTPTSEPTTSPTSDGCELDLNTYLDTCYCSENGESGMGIQSPFDQAKPDNYNPMQNGPNMDVILNILYINSFAIMVILVLLAYLVSVNGCSKGRAKGYGKVKVYDTEYDSERNVINS